MDATDKLAVKTALAILRAAGGTGVRKPALLDQIGLAAGAPTTEEQREAAFRTMMDRGWISWYMEPVWHDQRWILTERGMAALEAM